MPNSEMADLLRATAHLQHSELSALRVLLVEDNPDTALTQAMLLRLSGHEVVVAGDGLAAVELNQKFQPDVVLLDIGLPGMDGWQVAKAIQEHATVKRPFIIAITGYAREEDIRHSAEVGIDLHMVKPIDPQQLDAVLARFQRVIG